MAFTPTTHSEASLSLRASPRLSLGADDGMGGVIGQGRVPNHVPARRIAKVSCVNSPKGYNAEPSCPSRRESRVVMAARATDNSPLSLSTKLLESRSSFRSRPQGGMRRHRTASSSTPSSSPSSRHSDPSFDRCGDNDRKSRGYPWMIQVRCFTSSAPATGPSFRGSPWETLRNSISKRPSSIGPNSISSSRSPLHQVSLIPPPGTGTTCGTGRNGAKRVSTAVMTSSTT